MRLFVKQAFAFLLPIVVLIAIHIFILPIETWCSRCFEALSVSDPTSKLRGPFYPNRHLTMWETGDLAFRTNLTKPEQASWITDEWGFRYSGPEPRERVSVLIVGASPVYGAGLTQQDTLSDVLGRVLGEPAYPYSPSDLPDLVRHLTDFPSAKTIIWVMPERYLNSFHLTTKSLEVAPEKTVQPHRFIQVLVWEDRLYKASPFWWARAHVDRWLNATMDSLIGRTLSSLAPNVFLGTDHHIFFLKDELIPLIDKKRAIEVANDLVACQDWLAKKGIQLVVVPIPNKVAVYYRKVPLPTPHTNLPLVLPMLRSAGICVADLWKPFSTFSDRPEPVFRLDDSHWSALGVRMAAHEMKETMAACQPTVAPRLPAASLEQEARLK